MVINLLSSLVRYSVVRKILPSGLVSFITAHSYFPWNVFILNNETFIILSPNKKPTIQ